jgi:hypothetical protein
MTLQIKFNPTSELAGLVVPPPKPARLYIPDWYKKIPAFDTKTPKIDETGTANRTLKTCMPFADGMTAGYIQETWMDISIQYEVLENGEGRLQYNYPSQPAIMKMRETFPNIKLGDEFYPFEFTFHPAWVPELPKGWSMLYTHPVNQLNLPFQMLTGIVDNDGFTHSEQGSNMPFYIKKSFTGIIPKGTPIVQMIPIKREAWESSINPYSEHDQIKKTFVARQYFWGGYKKLYWNKKEYN